MAWKKEVSKLEEGATIVIIGKVVERKCFDEEEWKRGTPSLVCRLLSRLECSRMRHMKGRAWGGVNDDLGRQSRCTTVSSSMRVKEGGSTTHA
jgi:hypothetical protein